MKPPIPDGSGDNRFPALAVGGRCPARLGRPAATTLPITSYYQMAVARFGFDGLAQAGSARHGYDF
jgi:hypothetical protein